MLYSVSKMPNWPVLVHPIGQKMRSKFCHQIYSSIFLTIFFKTNIHVSAFECNRINRVRLLYSVQCCSNTSVCNAMHNVYFVQYIYLAIKQAETYRKSCISIYLLTYICPSSFDCEVKKCLWISNSKSRKLYSFLMPNNFLGTLEN